MVVLVVILVSGGLSSGCAPGELYLTPSTMVRTDSVQITDERIREAFSRRPQLTKPLNVAVYSAGTVRTSLGDSLRSFDGVRSVYELSPVLVEEDRYYTYRSDSWRRYARPPSAPLDKLRLLAAQGHADLLVVYTASHRYDEGANWLSSTYVLLLPALFVPGRRASLTTDVDVFFLDVRNGYLYASYHDRTETKKRYVTLFYGSDESEALAAEHVRQLMPGVVDAARTAINTDRFYVESSEDASGK
jgi:hypothetical protein